MPTLACYLLREDGEWYELGNTHRWGTSLIVFPGDVSGRTWLTPEDAPTLALTLGVEPYGYDIPTLERIAADIVRWCQRPEKPKHWATNPAYWVKFRTELDPEIVDPDVLPEPITGSLRMLGIPLCNV
mgnify:CR=1 FL=1